MSSSDSPVALITGAARRLGACTAKKLHDRGWRLVIHCNHSREEADAFAAQLNEVRAGSASVVQGNLSSVEAVRRVANDAVGQWQRLDAVVNNASVFYPTPMDSATADDWDAIMATNLRAPFELVQTALPALQKAGGVVINLIDIYSERPLANHPIYCASKAGLAALTRSWAKDLAPAIRVNGVSPGAILWPEQESDNSDHQKKLLEKVPLRRTGNPEDIASTVVFLICDAPYITGQIIPVDGGRSQNM